MGGRRRAPARGGARGRRDEDPVGPRAREPALRERALEGPELVHEDGGEGLELLGLLRGVVGHFSVGGGVSSGGWEKERERENVSIVSLPPRRPIFGDRSRKKSFSFSKAITRVSRCFLDFFLVPSLRRSYLSVVAANWLRQNEQRKERERESQLMEVRKRSSFERLCCAGQPRVHFFPLLCCQRNFALKDSGARKLLLTARVSDRVSAEPKQQTRSSPPGRERDRSLCLLQLS